MQGPSHRPEPALTTTRLLLVAVGASLLTALAAPASEAVLLWKRKPRQEAKPKARAATTRPVDSPAVSEEMVEPTAAAAPADLAGRALSALGHERRDGGAAAPEVVSSYPHELRRLVPAWESLQASAPGETAAAHLRYGNVLATLGHDGDAAMAYVAALDLEEGLTAAWNNLGSLVRRRGQLELAGAMFEHLLALDARDGLGWFNLALTREGQGRLPEADEAYVKALRLDPALWLPTHNPLIVGNERATLALHADYLNRSGSGSIFVDGPK